jgi:hypothetical protein
VPVSLSRNLYTLTGFYFQHTFVIETLFGNVYMLIQDVPFCSIGSLVLSVLN